MTEKNTPDDVRAERIDRTIRNIAEFDDHIQAHKAIAVPLRDAHAHIKGLAKLHEEKAQRITDLLDDIAFVHDTDAKVLLNWREQRRQAEIAAQSLRFVTGYTHHLNTL